MGFDDVIGPGQAGFTGGPPAPLDRCPTCHRLHDPRPGGRPTKYPEIDALEPMTYFQMPGHLTFPSVERMVMRRNAAARKSGSDRLYTCERGPSDPAKGPGSGPILLWRLK